MRKRMIIPRHEQKDGGLASDEGVTELFFARGTGPGRSPFMAQSDEKQTGWPAGRQVDKTGRAKCFKRYKSSFCLRESERGRERGKKEREEGRHSF